MTTITALNDIPLTHHLVPGDGITLHVVTAGDPANPPVLLLHGFPEFWYGWKHQIPALAQAGYYVLAPDQRGYNLSDKPRALEAYRLDRMADDAAAVIRWAGHDSACVAGHDWGAMVAWWLALRRPEMVRRLAILNVPHPSVMMENLRSSPLQMLKSWYIALFQIPRLPELLLAGGDALGAATMLLRSSNPGSFDDTDITRYTEAWKQPGAMTAMLNWYRAMAQRPSAQPASPMLSMPVLIQWGRKDIALEAEGAEKSLRYCPDGRLIFYDDATHWVQHDKPADVSRELIAFFTPPAVPTASESTAEGEPAATSAAPEASEPPAAPKRRPRKPAAPEASEPPAAPKRRSRKPAGGESS
jgi:pimeloyl-ACP methyl ester carboxylesterase